MKNIIEQLRFPFLLVLIALIGIMMSVTWYYGWYVVAYEEIPVTFVVVENDVGVLIEKELLHFGHVQPGGVAKRWINISVANPSKLLVSFDGPAADFLYVDAPTVLEPHETYSIELTVNPSVTTELGEYNGTAKIYVFRG